MATDFYERTAVVEAKQEELSQRIDRIYRQLPEDQRIAYILSLDSSESIKHFQDLEREIDAGR